MLISLESLLTIAPLSYNTLALIIINSFFKIAVLTALSTMRSLS